MTAKPPSKIRLEGDVAVVELTRGFEATIDAVDAPLLAPFRWCAHLNSETGHAYAARFEGGKCILMHRALLDPSKDEKVDHRDGDGLNNRRGNIRIATHSQNMANMAVTRRSKLGLKGVEKAKGRFRARIKYQDQTFNLGSYTTKEEAAAAYRAASIIIHKDFAYDGP